MTQILLLYLTLHFIIVYYALIYLGFVEYCLQSVLWHERKYFGEFVLDCAMTTL